MIYVHLHTWALQMIVCRKLVVSVIWVVFRSKNLSRQRHVSRCICVTRNMHRWGFCPGASMCLLGVALNICVCWVVVPVVGIGWLSWPSIGLLKFCPDSVVLCRVTGVFACGTCAWNGMVAGLACTTGTCLGSGRGLDSLSSGPWVSVEWSLASSECVSVWGIGLPLGAACYSFDSRKKVLTIARAPTLDWRWASPAHSRWATFSDTFVLVDSTGTIGNAYFSSCQLRNLKNFGCANNAGWNASLGVV